jgi:hypothetical protein
MYGPAGTYEPSVVEAATIASSPIPVAELLEVVGGWIADFPAVAAAVDVPVHYGLAEHEQLWHSGPAKVDEFAAAFTASPDVSAHHLAGVGHNIDHHIAGRQYRADVLDWAVGAGHPVTVQPPADGSESHSAALAKGSGGVRPV